MKVRARVKRICENCKLVRRHGKLCDCSNHAKNNDRAERGATTMPRILGVDLPTGQADAYSLRYITDRATLR